MFKYEKKIIDYIMKHYLIIFAIIASVLALYLRYCMLDFVSGDAFYFLSPWFEYLRNNGGLFALKSYPGDYNAPYMTIMAILTYLPHSGLKAIKCVSIVFDFVLAISGGLLLKEITKDKVKAIATYIILLFLPSVLMNSSLWAQCDSIYASFILISLLFLIKKKYVTSFIFLGLSFAFKLQFIFILPLYLLYYFNEKKFSVLNFLIIPTVNFILCLPAIIVGKPIVEVLKVYFNQTSTYQDSLVLGLPNIYNLFYVNKESVPTIYTLGIVITLILFLLLAIYVVANKIKFNNKNIFLVGILSIVVATYFLPGMHERYMYVGELLIVLYYLIYRKNLPILVFMIISPIITYSTFLFGLDYNYMPFLSIAYLIILSGFIKSTLIELKSEE